VAGKVVLVMTSVLSSEQCQYLCAILVEVLATTFELGARAVLNVFDGIVVTLEVIIEYVF